MGSSILSNTLHACNPARSCLSVFRLYSQGEFCISRHLYNHKSNRVCMVGKWSSCDSHYSDVTKKTVMQISSHISILWGRTAEFLKLGLSKSRYATSVSGGIRQNHWIGLSERKRCDPIRYCCVRTEWFKRKTHFLFTLFKVLNDRKWGNHSCVFILHFSFSPVADFSDMERRCLKETVLTYKAISTYGRAHKQNTFIYINIQTIKGLPKGRRGKR